MKLKFRADSHDLLIFGIFSAFLLYVVAVAVVNISNFAAEGQLAGLNPFPAFGPKYFVTTITFFFLALAALFASVSSYFFDREKGFGLTTEKKDKGYSRWAKEKEIKEELERVEIQQQNSKAAGIPLILNEKEMWVDNSEYHSLVIGATGSGKTQGVIFPQVYSLAKAKESMIITDPKGEIYEETSNMLRARGYQILLLNFRDPQQGSAWNPLTLPYKMYKAGNQDKAIELLDDLALNILYDESNKNADPFWEKTSADYFSGVALGLFEDAKEEEININSISLATTVGEEKFGGSTYIKEYFNAKDPSSAAAINASSTIMAPTETKGSILSVFKQKVKLFASRDNLSEMLSYSDVDLESIGERPTAVFIVIQDEKKTYHSLVTILLKQIYETLIATAQRHGGKLPVRTNFLLDEFANMPPLKDVTTMITAARSRKIRFTMIIQNFAQLDSVYGKEDAETIRGNCGNTIYLITTELKALEEISKMCGEVKSKKDDKTASTPLVTVSDLQRMKQYEVIIMRMRKQPFKTKVTPNFKLSWGRKYPKATYPERPKQPVKTFDIKEFVKAQKKKKLLEMMNSSDGDMEKNFPPMGIGRNPFGRDMGGRPNPFEPSGRPNPFESSGRPNPFEPSGRPNPFESSGRPNPFESSGRPNPFESSGRPNPFESIMRQNPFEAEAGSKPFESENKDKKTDNKDSDIIPKSQVDKRQDMEMVQPKEDIPRKPEAKPKASKTDNELGFDVDELVRKIDAKIAELEEEERREKEQKAAQQQALPTSTGSAPQTNLPATSANIDKKETKPNVNKEIEQQKKEINLDLDDNEDDDFFDDFFDN